MRELLFCYRCGHSLETLPLPLGRRDECPNCVAELHVCRMCLLYDPREPTGCSEEDALEVFEKERANFCDYFKPDPDAYSPGLVEAQSRAESQLASLFGDERASEEGKQAASGDGDTVEEDHSRRQAEELFK